jgi:MarR family transcriptional regulator, lower aerobic nicotinate degradation pathway regulator
MDSMLRFMRDKTARRQGSYLWKSKSLDWSVCYKRVRFVRAPSLLIIRRCCTCGVTCVDENTIQEACLSLDTFHTRPANLIRRLNQISQGLFQEEAGAFGLTSVQFAAMSIIRDVPGIDQVRLSALIAFDKTTVVKVLDRLELRGLITRERSQADRRSNLLRITADGARLLKQVAPLLDRSERRMVAPLNAVDQRKFMQLLSRLVQSNNEHSRAPMDPQLREGLVAERTRATRRPRPRSAKR